MRRKKIGFITMYLCSFCLMIFTVFMITNNSKDTYSASGMTPQCSKDAVLQLGKIIYREVGTDSAVNSNENFYMKITTASIVLNNANNKSGTTWYEKIYNLTDSNYENYSSYKNKDFNDVVQANKSQILYIAQLVLSGKYNVPTNMTLQADETIVKKYGTVWDIIYTYSGFYDTYFGYERATLNTFDVFGETIPDTSNTYYRNLAESLKLSDYSKYTVDNVCQVSLGGGSTVVSYKVNFYTDDAGNNLYKSINVTSNNTVSMPQNPTKDGYKFNGWTYKNGVSFDASTKINSNLDLYANWLINENPDDQGGDKIDEEFPPEENNENNNLSPDDTPQTGDSGLYIIILGAMMAILSIYFYKTRLSDTEN